MQNWRLRVLADPGRAAKHLKRVRDHYWKDRLRRNFINSTVAPLASSIAPAEDGTSLLVLRLAQSHSIRAISTIACITEKEVEAIIARHIQKGLS